MICYLLAQSTLKIGMLLCAKEEGEIGGGGRVRHMTGVMASYKKALVSTMWAVSLVCTKLGC